MASSHSKVVRSGDHDSLRRATDVKGSTAGSQTTSDHHDHSTGDNPAAEGYQGERETPLGQNTQRVTVEYTHPTSRPLTSEMGSTSISSASYQRSYSSPVDVGRTTEGVGQDELHHNAHDARPEAKRQNSNSESSGRHESDGASTSSYKVITHSSHGDLSDQEKDARKYKDEAQQFVETREEFQQNYPSLDQRNVPEAEAIQTRDIHGTDHQHHGLSKPTSGCLTLRDGRQLKLPSNIPGPQGQAVHGNIAAQMVDSADSVEGGHSLQGHHAGLLEQNSGAITATCATQHLVNFKDPVHSLQEASSVPLPDDNDAEMSDDTRRGISEEENEQRSTDEDEVDMEEEQIKNDVVLSSEVFIERSAWKVFKKDKLTKPIHKNIERKLVHGQVGNVQYVCLQGTWHEINEAVNLISRANLYEKMKMAKQSNQEKRVDHVPDTLRSGKEKRKEAAALVRHHHPERHHENAADTTDWERLVSHGAQSTLAQSLNSGQEQHLLTQGKDEASSMNCRVEKHGVNPYVGEDKNVKRLGDKSREQNSYNGHTFGDPGGDVQMGDKNYVMNIEHDKNQAHGRDNMAPMSASGRENMPPLSVPERKNRRPSWDEMPGSKVGKDLERNMEPRENSAVLSAPSTDDRPRKNRRKDRTFKHLDDLENTTQPGRQSACLHESALSQSIPLDNATFMTPEALTVRVYNADITQLISVDCIVNSTDDRMEHTGGAAAAIKKAAGKGFEKACKDYIRDKGPLKPGSCGVTGSGNLPYKAVIHVVAPSTRSSRDQTDTAIALKETLARTLVQANELKMQSLALSGIGTGVFGFPKKEWADIASTVLKSFSQKHKDKRKRFIQEVHIVDIHSELLRTVKAVLGADQRFQNDRTPPTTGPDSTTKNRGVSAESSGTSSGHTFTITKYCKVVIHKGDISKATVDAIVCTEDTSFAGIGALAKAIAKAGGNRYVKDKERLKFDIPKFGIREGNVLVTAPGKLPCRKVLHFILPTRIFTATLQSGLQSILSMAAKEGVRTLALPAIGMGAGGVQKDSGCGVVADTICRYLRSNNSSLAEIQLIDMDASRIELLCIEFSKYLSMNDVPGLPSTGGNQEKRLSSEVSSARQSHTGAQERGASQASGSSDIPSPLQSEAGYQKCHYCQIGHKNIFPLKGCTKGHMLCPGCIIPGNPVGCQSCQRGDPAVHLSPNKPDQDENKDDCVICLSSMTDPKSLSCGHAFCKGCIDKYFSLGYQICPICKKVCGKMTGNQPHGTMHVTQSTYMSCSGYERCGTFTITYIFNSGTQAPGHPNPGKFYKGTQRTAYLPMNKEGRKIVRLLKQAFGQGVLFTIGTSVTTGRSDVVTWNDIHHKTSMFGGPQKYGYPDPSYLARVQEELKAKGITDDYAEDRKSESTV